MTFNNSSIVQKYLETLYIKYTGLNLGVITAMKMIIGSIQLFASKADCRSYCYKAKKSSNYLFHIHMHNKHLLQIHKKDFILNTTSLYSTVSKYPANPCTTQSSLISNSKLACRVLSMTLSVIQKKSKEQDMRREPNQS